MKAGLWLLFVPPGPDSFSVLCAGWDQKQEMSLKRPGKEIEDKASAPNSPPRLYTIPS